MEEYEEFTEPQLRILERFVTNTTSPVFVLRNLPEAIKGALFSRYSRSTLGLRSLLLKDFILNEETAFEQIVGKIGGPLEETADAQLLAIHKAQTFYDRILDGYGDDSIGELGGAHLAVEQISMLAANAIEDCRIGGSPLEKSTRYVYFDQKVRGDYLFYREPVLMTSAYRDLYLETCNLLFDTYSKLIPPLTELMEKRFPKHEEVSRSAYTSALRARVLDCLRGLLPVAALTNMGVYGNGRFFQTLLHKLQCHNLVELQEIGRLGYEELGKVMPSFIRRADPNHHHHQQMATYYETVRAELRHFESLINTQEAAGHEQTAQAVRLIRYTADAPHWVAAALLFPTSHHALADLFESCRQLPGAELDRILDAGCNARENRRHKSPRALEHAEFTFELMADYGIYRDLHRHRMLTQERQLLTCHYGYFVPSELEETELLDQYCSALDRAKSVYDVIAAELPEEAQYVVPMAYRLRWYFHVNLRALQWMCELRSQAAGHPTYRYLTQAMADQVTQQFPQFARYFKFVDYEGYDLGRLSQEERHHRRQSIPVD
jgi:thymidylate synthase ThyX